MSKIYRHFFINYMKCFDIFKNSGPSALDYGNAPSKVGPVY